MIDRESPTAYAVLDPGQARNREMIAALGTDCLELESHRFDDLVGVPCFRVKVSALGPDRVVKLCRLLARRHGMTLAGAMVEAVQGRGIALCAQACYVCQDPAVGREFFAGRARDGGPS